MVYVEFVRWPRDTTGGCDREIMCSPGAPPPSSGLKQPAQPHCAPEWKHGLRQVERPLGLAALHCLAGSAT